LISSRPSHFVAEVLWESDSNNMKSISAIATGLDKRLLILFLGVHRYTNVPSIAEYCWKTIALRRKLNTVIEWKFPFEK
jgi:hypothetical protein